MHGPYVGPAPAPRVGVNRDEAEVVEAHEAELVELGAELLDLAGVPRVSLGSLWQTFVECWPVFVAIDTHTHRLN